MLIYLSSIIYDKNLKNIKLLKFIFTVGLEGSGHRMIRDVLTPLFRQKNFYDEPEEIFFFLRDFNRVENKELEKNLIKIKKFLKTLKNSSIYLSPSYPFGRTDRLKNIPNLSEAILWLNSKLKNKIQIKIIHLDRSIQDSTLSALNRGYSKNYREACNQLNSSAVILDQQISTLKRKFKILKLDYDFFIKKPYENCGKLTKYLNIENKYSITEMANIWSIENKYSIPENVISNQKKFFLQKDVINIKKFFKNKKFINVKNKFNNSLTNQKIFIYHHMGLGDFISCNAIIRKLCNQKKDIFLSVRGIPILGLQKLYIAGSNHNMILISNS